MTQWYAVLNEAGEHVSTGTEVADPLPEGFEALPIDESLIRGHVWDPAARAFVPLTPPVKAEEPAAGGKEKAPATRKPAARASSGRSRGRGSPSPSTSPAKGEGSTAAAARDIAEFMEHPTGHHDPVLYGPDGEVAHTATESPAARETFDEYE